MARRGAGPVPIAQPKGELTSLLAARYSDIRLTSMVLAPSLGERLGRILKEQRQQERLRARGLSPRRKLLLVGPPGSGKTMTALALAGELKLPLFTVLYDGLIGKMTATPGQRDASAVISHLCNIKLDRVAERTAARQSTVEGRLLRGEVRRLRGRCRTRLTVPASHVSCRDPAQPRTGRTPSGACGRPLGRPVRRPRAVSIAVQCQRRETLFATPSCGTPA